MTKRERVREVMAGPLTPEYLKKRAEDGWTLVGISLEWEREAGPGQPQPADPGEEVPYGLQVAGDCLHLEENPSERQVLIRMMELIVEDFPLSRVADELNRQNFRTRHGQRWTASAVFNMIPRLVETGPRIFTSSQWVELRRRLSAVVG